MCLIPFSIIIPTYNAGASLENALRSILKQTEPGYEVIIMDGGSTDDTLAVVNRFSESFGSRLKFFSGQDRGIYDAMNGGIKKAQGEWLYFLGADDYLADEFVLARVQELIGSLEPDFIYGDISWTDNGKQYGGSFDLARLQTENICHQAIFIKKAVIARTGGFNDRYKTLADWDMNIRCFLRPGLKIRYVPLLVAYHSPGGLSNRYYDALFYRDRDFNIARYKLLGSSLSNWPINLKVYVGRLQWRIRQRMRDFLIARD